jgi:sulfite exporter TauE/SafE
MSYETVVSEERVSWYAAYGAIIIPNDDHMSFQCNVGGVDRTIRMLLGVVIIALGVYFNNVWGLLGVVLLLTGAFKWCPAYIPFHISTYTADAGKSDDGEPKQ